MENELKLTRGEISWFNHSLQRAAMFLLMLEGVTPDPINIGKVLQNQSLRVRLNSMAAVMRSLDVRDYLGFVEKDPTNRELRKGWDEVAKLYEVDE